MEVTWTREQQQVIDLHQRSLLVSAAAGSGKTAVLVERIIQMILKKEHPMDIDRLLVVTFTNAAAAEMRERIGAALERALAADPENTHLQSQVTLVHNAQISTIHSFGLQVIRSHFYEIDLDPAFRIGDEREIRMLKEDVLDQVLEDAYEEGGADFLYLIDSYGNTKNDQNIREMIADLYEYANSYPWPEEWLARSLAMYQCDSLRDLDEQPWMQELFSYLGELVDAMLKLEDKMADLASGPVGPVLYLEAIRDDREKLERLRRLDSYDGWQDALQSFSFQALSRKKQDCDPEIKKEIQKLRDRVKKELSRIRTAYFSYTPQQQLDMLKDEAVVMRVLVKLTTAFMEQFAREKADRNLLDFSDIEHFTLNILVDPRTKQPTDAAKEYQKKFLEVMVDEYQDSNYVQEALIQAVSRESAGEPNVFMVGDVKQSIYRFRLARPELFMEKYNTYTQEDSAHQRIDLHKNFRSRKEVLTFTNEIFDHIMDADMGNVTYDEAAALYPGAVYEEPKRQGQYQTELIGIEAGEQKEDKVAVEARCVAGKIRKLAQNGVPYKDMVILVHALKGWSEVFVRVFSEEGIPLVTMSKTGYFSAVEVQTMIQFLKLLDNPRQDIPLAGVLTSIIGGFSGEELAKMRAAFPELSFEGCVRKWGKLTFQEEAALAGQAFLDPKSLAVLEQKTKDFWAMTDRLRERIPDTPIHELIQEIFEETGYLLYVTALPGGAKRRANLEMFLELAIAYESTSYRGLFHFVRYMEQMLKYELDYGEAEVISNQENAVRLMTIHKSKGLEFPVVFLCGMGKEFNMMSLGKPLIFHPQYGVGMRWMNGRARTKRSGIPRQVFALLERRELLGEEQRLLYVALTRAREKLILTGILDRDHLCEGIRLQPGEKLSFVQRMDAKCFWDWVLPVMQSKDQPWQLTWLGPEEQDIRQEDHRQQLADARCCLEEKLEQFSGEAYETWNARMDWKYPYEVSGRRKQKVSVSELKHRFMEEQILTEAESLYPQPEAVPYLPKFLQGEEAEYTGVLGGTAMHRFLECFDFSGLLDLGNGSVSDWVRQEAVRIRSEKRMDEATCERLNISKLSIFAGSDIAFRMGQADSRGQLYRERPFVMSLPAREVWADAQEEDPVLVQGIVDVFWMESDGIILLDYKTDRVDDPKELIRRYRIQLLLYAQALSRVFENCPVKEILIYSFHFGRFFPVTVVEEE